MSDFRIGRIAYTNVVPVYAGIDAGEVEAPGTIVAANPARLNKAIADGSLDVSPISAAYYLRNRNDLVLLPDLCVGSRREVMSVVLASPQPLGALDGSRIAVTDASASGRALVEMLARAAGSHVVFEPVSDPLAVAATGTATLLIGEAALDAVATLPAAWIHDLGAAWHAWTGQDMVFAVWAARADVARRSPSIVERTASALQASLAWSVAHPSETIALAQAIADRPAALYARYFRTLNYVLDAAARAGLDRFASELAALDAAHAPTEALRVAR